MRRSLLLLLTLLLIVGCDASSGQRKDPVVGAPPAVTTTAPSAATDDSVAATSFTATAAPEPHSTNPSPTPSPATKSAARPSPTPTSMVPAGVAVAAEPWIVVKVVSGDTFVATNGLREETIVLAGIGAPEDAAPGDGGECYGEEATARLGRTLSPGRTVWLERADVNRSRAGLLRYAWVVGDNGRVALVNESLVRRGYAAVSRSGLDAAHEQRLGDAQERAAADGAGLWAACGGNHVPLPTPTPRPTRTPRPTAVPTLDTSTFVGGDGCTYRNVDGVQVSCPVQSDTQPAGATARCNDGTWSFSQHRQGTCSHHGGVAYWL